MRAEFQEEKADGSKGASGLGKRRRIVLGRGIRGQRGRRVRSGAKMPPEPLGSPQNAREEGKVARSAENTLTRGKRAKSRRFLTAISKKCFSALF